MTIKTITLVFNPLQVNKRAMEVWGNEQSLEDEKERREDNKDKAKRKKYEKRIKGSFFYFRFTLFRNENYSFRPCVQ